MVHKDGNFRAHLARSCHLSEIATLVQMSLPIVGTYVLQSAFGLITAGFTGHLGVDQLAGATLGMLLANLTGVRLSPPRCPLSLVR